MMFVIVKVLAFFGCVLSATEARYLNHGEKSNNIDQDFFPQKEQISATAITKPLAELIVSEYNRVTSTNRNLYIQSRVPYVSCSDDDITSCHITLYLVETACNRLAPRANCKSAGLNSNFMKCTTMVDLLGGEVISPLRCMHIGKQIQSNNMDDQTFFSKGAPEELDSSEFYPEEFSKVSKKQWEIYDGNPFPF